MIKKRSSLWQGLGALLKALLITFGTLTLVMTLLALTSAPFWIWYNLAKKNAGIHRPPEYIVIMGGGGMPSESALMRCWYGAAVAGHFTRSKVIIALPGDTADPKSSVNQMKQELVLRGVAPERILFEDSGTNTRAEALNILKLLSVPSRATRHVSILIITSPEHLCRSVLTFEKAGFRRVGGIPAFEKTIETNLSFNARKLGSKRWVPDVGENLTVRYQFWLHLEYQLLVMREYFALGYYKLQGWI